MTVFCALDSNNVTPVAIANNGSLDNNDALSTGLHDWPSRFMNVIRFNETRYTE